MKFNDLIVLNDKQEQAVSGRLLHEALGVESQYSHWFERMVAYGFVEGDDFGTISQKKLTAQGNESTYTNHILTMDMAKQLCMITRNEKGMAIRKYFIEVEKDWNSPLKTMARALLFADKAIKEKDVEIKQLTEKIEENKPKVLFADALTASDTTILVRDLAKMLRANGVEIGEKRLYVWMREHGYICQHSTMPTQRAMEMGLFELDTHVIRRGYDDLPMEVNTTRVTTKGQSYFVNKFLRKDE